MSASRPVFEADAHVPARLHGRKGIQRVYDQHTYEDEMRDALKQWAARLRSSD
jgi:uncharacterized protein YecE (DUF72 family)